MQTLVRLMDGRSRVWLSLLAFTTIGRSPLETSEERFKNDGNIRTMQYYTVTLVKILEIPDLGVRNLRRSPNRHEFVQERMRY